MNMWKARDIRTFADIMCGVDNGQFVDLKLPGIETFIKHDCLHDAAKDAASMVEAYHMT